MQVKTTERDGYTALQVTYGRKDPRKLTKPEAGHFARAGVEAGTNLVELRLDDIDGYSVGDELKVDLLEAGERVDVTAVSRGKGFAGVMKRHNFGGQKASHGTHRVHRMPGSIGQCSTPGRVFRGMKMAGHMGAEKVTTLNLEVVAADAEPRPAAREGLDPGARRAESCSYATPSRPGRRSSHGNGHRAHTRRRRCRQRRARGRDLRRPAPRPRDAPSGHGAARHPPRGHAEHQDPL